MAFYAYSTLPLIVEIGGHAGLFLRISFFNLGNYGNYLERLYRSLLNWSLQKILTITGVAYFL